MGLLWLSAIIVLGAVIIRLVYQSEESNSLASGGLIKAKVGKEPAYKQKEKVMKKDTYGFTVDVENLVRICMNDPATREMVYNGIRKGAMDHTTPLGASNMKDSKEDPDEWFTAFLGTSNKVAPGEEGFVLRNGNGQGPRISIRLKRQTAKTHTAATNAALEVLLPPAQLSDENELLKRALSGDKVAAQALLDMAGYKSPEADEVSITL